MHYKLINIWRFIAIWRWLTCCVLYNIMLVGTVLFFSFKPVMKESPVQVVKVGGDVTPSWQRRMSLRTVILSGETLQQVQQAVGCRGDCNICSHPHLSMWAQLHPYLPGGLCGLNYRWVKYLHKLHKNKPVNYFNLFHHPTMCTIEMTLHILIFYLSIYHHFKCKTKKFSVILLGNMNK